MNKSRNEHACTYVTHVFRRSSTECFSSPALEVNAHSCGNIPWRGFGSVCLPQFDPARVQPICALLLNPLLLHPHPTIALHVLPSPPLQIITAHHGSQEDSPLLCSCPQRFHQARLPRHPSPYRPGWYRSYRVRVGQRSSGRPCFRSSWYVIHFMSDLGWTDRLFTYRHVR